MAADAITHSYDIMGQVTSVADTDSQVDTAHDLLSRSVGNTQTFAGNAVNLTSAYDLLDRRTELDDPTGTTSYTYDNLGRLKTLTDPTARVFGLSYDAAPRLTTLTRPNGVDTAFTYSVADELETMLHRKAGVEIAGTSYTLNAIGNRASESREDGVTSVFSYDGNDRLIGAASTAPVTVLNESLTYDLEGNWTVDGRVHGPMNELLEDSRFSYNYDAEGNLARKASKNDLADVTNYTYDAENRLVAISTPGLTASYRYDPLGRRIAKIINGVTTRHVLDGQNVLLELDGSNQLVATNTHAGLDNLLVRDDETGVHYLHADGVNSTIALTNPAGAVEERYRYTAFGQLDVRYPDFTPKISNQPLLAYTYTGREWEPETGNYFYRARFYDAELGRFQTRDPIGENGG